MSQQLLELSSGRAKRTEIEAMALLRTPITTEIGPLIRSERVTLRPPALSHFTQWAALRAASRAHLTPFEPQWCEDELSKMSYRRRVRHYQRELRDDMGYAFFIFLSGTDNLVGGITLGNVRRGVTQAATLGYWIGGSFAGQGLMTTALRSLLPFAFDTLRLHRLEAACLAHNIASISVLASNGFQHEGVARKYLKINGSWQDHQMFALLEDDLSS